MNDLDLYVRDPSGTYYRGNQYSQGQSIPNPPARDTLNVEECVGVNAPVGGDWLVRIDARNIPYGPQPFALVITYTGSSTAGFLAFDKTVYRANDFVIDTVRVRVEDLNYGTAGVRDTVLVVIKGKHIETQPETLRCIELAENSYVFKGEIHCSSVVLSIMMVNYLSVRVIRFMLFMLITIPRLSRRLKQVLMPGIL